MSDKERNQCGESKVRLAFVGCPLLDITTECGPDLLHKFGLLPDTCILATDRHVALFDGLLGDPRSRKDSGGSALNSAKVAKWVLGRKGRVAFAGCVGDDTAASILESELENFNVEPLLISVSGQSTGICACLLGPGATRSMCTRQGAAALLSPEHLLAGDVHKFLQVSDCIFAVAYLAVRCPEVLRDLVNRLVPDQLFALSLSAEYICRDYKDLLQDLLPYVDILFANDREILAFAEALGIVPDGETRANAEMAACAIASLQKSRGGPRVVVVTSGQDPVILVKGNEKGKPLHFPVPQNVSVLDAVGCGDALAGAFLAAYLLNGDTAEAISAGIRAATEIAQVSGCSPPKDKEFV